MKKEILISILNFICWVIAVRIADNESIYYVAGIALWGQVIIKNFIKDKP